LEIELVIEPKLYKQQSNR